MTKKGNRLTLPVRFVRCYKINYYFQYHTFEAQGYNVYIDFSLLKCSLMCNVCEWAEVEIKTQITLSISDCQFYIEDTLLPIHNDESSPTIQSYVNNVVLKSFFN